MLLKMALRNIFRNKRRSILTILMMICGYVLSSTSFALTDGSYGKIISLFTRQNTGHVQITNKDYAENPSLYRTIKNYVSVMDEISIQPEVIAFNPRIYSGALAFFQNKTTGVEIVGIHPQMEEIASSYHKRILNGKSLREVNKEYTAVLGKKAAKVMGIGLNQDLILISQGADGSIANDIFKVVGIIGEEFGGKDDFRVYLSLKDASEYLSLYNQVHEIPIHLENINSATSFAKRFKVSEENTIRPWQVVESEFYKAMESDKKGNNFSLLIILIMVGVTVLNTILMSTLERTREFGVLKAMGTKGWQLSGLVIIESLMLSLVSCILGAFVALGVNYYFMTRGIKLDEPLKFGGMLITENNAVINASSFLLPAALIIITAFISSLYPSYKVNRVSVVDSLRSF